MPGEAFIFAELTQLPSRFRLRTRLPISPAGCDIPVQRDFGDLERPADFLNRVFWIIVEGLGNTALLSS
jgi:hypothetical protein